MKIYFGLDGGASSTRAVLVDSSGKTLNKKKLNKGTNLKVYQDLASRRIGDLILELCDQSSISIDDIDGFGLLSGFNFKVYYSRDSFNLSGKCGFKRFADIDPFEIRLICLKHFL